MFGKKLLLTGKIIFDSPNRPAATIQPFTPPLVCDEYGRLWAAHHVKVFEVLGYPANIDALLAPAVLENITVAPFRRNTDCFARAGPAEIVEYAEDRRSGLPVMTLRYYACNEKQVLVCDLPLDIPTKHLVHTSVGLFQYGLNRCVRNKQGLLLLYRSANNILFLLRPDSGHDVRDLSRLPDTAYPLATRIRSKDEQGVDKHSQKN
jgi:hypothetical protein